MKRQYYYTVTSLPYLSYDKPCPIRQEDFLSLCQVELTKTDFVTLQSVTLFPDQCEKDSLLVIRNWNKWERSIRNELVKLRAAKLAVDADIYIRGSDPERSLYRLAQEIFEVKSPLAAEEMLNRARLKFLEEMERDQYFTLARLVIYFLKLKIMAKKSNFNTEKGREKLKIILNQASADEIRF